MMTRTLLTIVLAAVLVFTAGGGATAGSDLGAALTVSGRLEYVTEPATPHYEVGGYILLAKDPATLTSLSGQDVVVTGRVSTAPSIYMHKTLEVLTITLKAAMPPAGGGGPITIPVMPAPVPHLPPGPGDVVILPVPPGPGDVVILPVLPGPGDVVTLPVLPGPGDVVTLPVLPGPGDVVTIPAFPDPVPFIPADPPKNGGVITLPEPLPLFGTPYWVLYGRVEYTGKGYVMAQERMSGHARIPLRSDLVDLAAFAGEQSGLVVERDGSPADPLRYRVIAGVILTGDLGERIRSGDGVIYSAPEHAISVRLHGKPLTMDQLPILGNGRTLVGLRAIGEALGANVSWSEATQTASVALGTREVAVTVGSTRLTIRETGKADRLIESDIAPVIAGGRTMVPVRVLAESLGLQVGWDPATRTVILN
jgi:hypothetical protein